MKLNSWRKLALAVVVAGAIAMTVTIDGGGATVKAAEDRGVAAKTGNSAAPHTAGRESRASSSSKQQSLRVELERLARPLPEPENAPQAAASQPAGAQVAAQQDAVQQQAIHRQMGQPDVAAEKSDGIFRVASWYVPPPPPPPAPPPPPPKPTAPPMPFSYLGRYQEAQAVILMLVRGDRIYTVSAGDVIDNIYRVEGVVGGRVELTYLPLNIKQTIDTGEAS